MQKHACMIPCLSGWTRGCFFDIRQSKLKQKRDEMYQKIYNKKLPKSKHTNTEETRATKKETKDHRAQTNVVNIQSWCAKSNLLQFFFPICLNAFLTTDFCFSDFTLLTSFNEMISNFFHFSPPKLGFSHDILYKFSQKLT